MLANKALVTFLSDYRKATSECNEIIARHMSANTLEACFQRLKNTNNNAWLQYIHEKLNSLHTALNHSQTWSRCRCRAIRT